MRNNHLLSLAALVTGSHALIGFGIDMYKPLCAFACRGSIAGAPLVCTPHDHSGGHSGHGGGPTTPACYSQDTSFLTTLAWCISERCPEVDEWKLERYWYKKASANNDERITPKWTYQEALDQVVDPPTRPVNTSELLDFTGTVADEDYQANVNGNGRFECIALLVLGAGIPILMTMLAFLPGFEHFFSKLKPYLSYPSLIGKYHVQSLPYLIGNSPTFGQTSYIVVFFLLNILFTALDYKSITPNSWFTDTKSEILIYVANRTGVLAFALAPLVILFAGRNNVLLWLTNWSHSTYLLLHRWIARIFTLQIILHSILELVYYKHTGEYEAEVVQKYWIWGIVATLAACIMIVASVIWFRRAAYEVFLVLHILLAAILLIGSWYHVDLLYERRWGYEFWLYAAFAVWFFDRVLRALWIARNGIQQAEWTEVDDNIIRMDVLGVRWGLSPGQHAYLYFPGAKRWTFWEAHPFSVIPLVQHNGRGLNVSALQSDTDSNIEAADNKTNDLEKSAVTSTRTPAHRSSLVTNHTVIGVRMYLRKHSGITKALHANSSPTVLLEGPYYNHNPWLKPGVSSCDRIILLAGGIGITGVLSHAYTHPAVKLYWSVKTAGQALVDDVRRSGMLDHLSNGVTLNVGGARFDFEILLGEECIGQEPRTKLGVVVCGPASFCDDARAAVVKVARRTKIDIELCEEAFSW
ncbi:hypothetical protein LTR64_004650 [Lithohypha guttulata]|uniref:uncharacterized protein n=1 Tax=Lithohypha guttulata TaxID=1690604 RepID=UPI002DDE820C|nr:hypothetical protein LTR51_006052 [Lithohypha guttulata]